MKKLPGNIVCQLLKKCKKVAIIPELKQRANKPSEVKPINFDKNEQIYTNLFANRVQQVVASENGKNEFNSQKIVKSI